VLVVVAAMLILAIGALMVSGLERDTARSSADRERAELAARAGLEEVMALLRTEAANDDFLIVRHVSEPKSGSRRQPADHLFLARGSSSEGGLAYRYLPLFSTSSPAQSAAAPLRAPEPVRSADAAELETVPWQDPAAVDWITITDAAGKAVSRYAFWVEDLQGKLDARVAGNLAGDGGVPARPAHPLPSAAPLEAAVPPLAAIEIGALAPDDADATRLLIDGRPAMLSPDSILGATGIGGPDPISRDPATGLLANAAAAAFERSVSPVNHSYLERPVVPFAPGFSAAAMGAPKLNLNRLLAAERPGAVREFASWIASALPRRGSEPGFEDRKGGFPENYLETLAANAFDYADEDSESTVAEGRFLGLDAFPLLSEIVLHIEFQGIQPKGSGYTLNWRMRVFAELWNMTNLPARGDARLSYEVNLLPESINSSDDPVPFDDPSLLDDSTRSTHNLNKIGGKYFGPPVAVNLLPGEYRFYEFADVRYEIPFTPQMGKNGPKAEPFRLAEPEADARGISLRWNDRPVQRIATIVRDPYGVSGFVTTKRNTAGKAAIPGHSYEAGGPVNNMGDPRIAHYLRAARLSENSYPGNVSPGRRNIRRQSIYDKDGPEKLRHYGRVLPSEWPDGGHDSAAGEFSILTDDSILPTAGIPQWPAAPAPAAADAPQRISNAGRFFSATELGNVYDPILWTPVYPDLAGDPGSGLRDTRILQPPPDSAAKPEIPPARHRFPEVSAGSVASPLYGGGNTLRIGRPEHEKFDRPGQRACQLLDLFHAGIASSGGAAEREGPVERIEGRVNINTASRDALRAIAAGRLRQDPKLARVTAWTHLAGGISAPATAAVALGAPTAELAADRIADALILRRPFASISEIASITGADGKPVFGNPDLYPEKDLQWTDAATEEIFARVCDASTPRSRNFRVWVVGQTLGSSRAVAEVRKVFTVFADPGPRDADGAIDPAKSRPRVTYENDF
jgi:hypothetical protein